VVTQNGKHLNLTWYVPQDVYYAFPARVMVLIADLEEAVQADSEYELLYVKYQNSGNIIDVFNKKL
jgi:hypothetical protein